MQNLYALLAPYLLAVIETLLLIGTAVLVLFSIRRNAEGAQPSAFERLERLFSRLAYRKNLSVIVVGLGVVVIRVGLIPVLGVPQPRFNDEFSYLLAADTFAHGRLTNPTHPMWIHFESFHIIEQPTYMSMYPPAQGIVLAAGQLLGSPWIGQVFITALMCSALCWMLQAWLPPPWALLGAALAVMRLGILSYWMNTYWCAAVAALGGALVLGAWPRLRERHRVRYALVMGAGLVILANSRPYEGLIFSIPVATAMLSWLARTRGPELRQSLSGVVLPLVAVLICGALTTGYYYHHVTGDAFRMTYQVNRGTYATAPYFIWQTPQQEPVYYHAVMRNYYRWELGEFYKNRTLSGYIKRAAEKAESWWQFYLGPLLTLPLLALPWVARQKTMRLPLAILGTMMLGFSIQTWTLPHYFSPATGALYIVILECSRYLWRWRSNGHLIGKELTRAIPVLAVVMIVLRVMAAIVHVQIEPAWPRGNLARAHVAGELARIPGKQLVLVRYGSRHDIGLEWIWNAASIDSSKVVWARDMNDLKNYELLNYFKDRRVWRINGDDSPPRLEPYEAPAR